MLTHDQLARLCRARKALRDSGSVEVSLTEIALSAAMSRFHFVRQFKALFGEAPSQCRTRARLDRARDLLVSGDQSVTDICMAVGFSSLGSFSAVFARRFGEAPSAYRARLRERPEQLVADCIGLMRGAWEAKAQISRSRGVST